MVAVLLEGRACTLAPMHPKWITSTSSTKVSTRAVCEIARRVSTLASGRVLYKSTSVSM